MSPLGPTSTAAGALRDAGDAVAALAAELRRLGERHAADHDVLHMSRTLGVKLDEAVAALARHAEDRAAPEPDHERTGGPLAPAREKLSQLTGARPIAGALLLADLRRFLGVAGDASVACTILVQGGHATRDGALIDTATAAHELVERTHRWALTRLKTTAPQVLAGSG